MSLDLNLFLNAISQLQHSQNIGHVFNLFGQLTQVYKLFRFVIIKILYPISIDSTRTKYFLQVLTMPLIVVLNELITRLRADVLIFLLKIFSMFDVYVTYPTCMFRSFRMVLKHYLTQLTLFERLLGGSVVSTGIDDLLKRLVGIDLSHINRSTLICPLGGALHISY